MEHILKVIENDLKTLNKDERDEFRKTILKSFMHITQGIEKKIINFEEKILETVGNNSENKDIFISLITKSEYLLYEDKFFPIDLKLNLDISLKDVLVREKKVLKEIYISLPHDELNIVTNKIISINVSINNQSFIIKGKLIKNIVYEKAIDNLFQVYCLNNLKWKTVLNPYLNKMFLLEIVEFDEKIVSLLDGNEEIIIEKGELDFNWHEDIILCWNIKESTIISDGIIRPTKDRIHLENILNFTSNKNIYICPLENCHIYLVEKVGIDQLLIISEDIKNNSWKIWEIKNIDSNKLKNLSYGYYSNKMNLHFINKLKLEKDLRIRTIVELERILYSFDIFKEYFKFLTVSIEDAKENIKYKNYDLNPFILDEFKLKEYQKILKIKVKKRKDNEFTIDILSFILSEIQLYFPEYYCVGDIYE